MSVFRILLVNFIPSPSMDPLEKLGKQYICGFINNKPIYFFPINNNPGYEDESTILKVVLSGNTDGKYKLCLKVMGMNNHCVKKLSSNDFKYENVFISQENSKNHKESATNTNITNQVEVEIENKEVE